MRSWGWLGCVPVLELHCVDGCIAWIFAFAFAWIGFASCLFFQKKKGKTRSGFFGLFNHWRGTGRVELYKVGYGKPMSITTTSEIFQNQRVTCSVT